MWFRKVPLHTIALASIVALTWIVPTAARQASSPKPVDITGTYKLVTIDGRKLPTAVGHDADPGPTVTAGSLTLNSDGTFASSITLVAPNGDPVTAQRKGTYSRSEATLDLAWDGAGHTKATTDAAKLTMTNEGLNWGYVKNEK